MTITPALYSSTTDEWLTPPAFFAKLNRRYQFTLDPCATADNAKCALYYTKEHDDLKQDWGQHRVFCNPPYRQEIDKWARKCFEASQSGALVVSLVLARTREWFHDRGARQGRGDFRSRKAAIRQFQEQRAVPVDAWGLCT